MRKLDDLIREYCPDGVEYKKLEEICEINRGTRVIRKNLLESGTYPVYQNSLTPLGFFEKYNCEAETTYIIAAGAAGEIGYSNKRFWAADDCYYFTSELIDSRYLFHVLLNQQIIIKSKVRKASVPRLSRIAIQKLIVPVPPLPVQREIVRILDKYSEKMQELKETLEKEKEDREKQYEYYRDKLLTFDENNPIAKKYRPDEVKYRTVKDVCKNVVSGGTPKSSNKAYYGGNIPWLRTQEVDWIDIYETSMTITEEGLENSSAKWIPKNCVIVAMYGATAAKTAINKIPLTTNQACCNLEIDENIALYKYVYYWLCKNYLVIKNMGQGSQSNINALTIKKFKIPIPPLPMQQEIVQTLDRFNDLCNDMTTGLPAEIEARQKQYTYYRDKLLDFKPLKKRAE